MFKSGRIMNHFLKNDSRNSGCLLRPGEPDVDDVAKMILNFFMRRTIPTVYVGMEGRFCTRI